MNNCFLPDIKVQATKSLCVGRAQRNAALNKFIRSSTFEYIHTRTVNGEKIIGVFLNKILNSILNTSCTLSVQFFKIFIHENIHEHFCIFNNLI